jgi:ATP-dependent helicase HepA
MYDLHPPIIEGRMLRAMSFAVGTIVALRADPRRKGPIIHELEAVGGMRRYRVFHGPDDMKEYLENQLELADTPSPCSIETTLIQQRFVAPEIFRARLTAARLRHPATDNIYALHAARIRRVPFQLKPLLRFLRADRPRLLIADEVGVGKTIEAGLILKELDTRRRLDNVLILCPKVLVTKWIAEMRRFDERFRSLTPDVLRYCLRETSLDGAWPLEYGRAVVNLELLRREELLYGSRQGGRRVRGLLELDPPPRFDLLIVDEAHYLRTPGTNAHTLARFLCDNSEAALFLSATPLHLGSQSLFTLLELLRPGLFQSREVFQEMLEPNRHLAQAMRHVRSRRPAREWQEAAATALARAAATTWGHRVLAQDPCVNSWRENLANGLVVKDSSRVQCLRDLEEAHTLAHVMNRTRRRDIGPFTIRAPVTVTVEFTPPQQALYDAVVSYRRSILTLQYDPRVAALVTDTFERQAASCLYALAPLIDKLAAEGQFVAKSIADGLDEGDEHLRLPNELIQRAEALRAMAAALPPHDQKLSTLLSIVRDTLQASGPKKLLIFSFFLHTIAYLEKHLIAAGCRVGVMSGQIREEEREELRRRFRLPHGDRDAIDVLVSSEVGSEGLDYEFCDRLVNYDIPWNPMRIEQRIGRIDRFGQTSEKVSIYNFICPATVEGRIFFRCFARLGIFRDTVGDMEEVLGQLVADINANLLDLSLTLEQQEERAQQLTDNALRVIDEQRRLEEESIAFLGLENAFSEDVDKLLQEGRFVSGEALLELVTVFVAQAPLNGQLAAATGHPGVHRLRLNAEARAELLVRVRAWDRRDHQTMAFRRWLEGKEPHLLLTFDQRVAIEHRALPFVTPVHPLARLAVEFLVAANDVPAARFSIESALPEGRYLFVFDLWESIGIIPELRLVPSAWNLDKGNLSSEVASGLPKLLGEAAAPDRTWILEGDNLSEALRHLDEFGNEQRLHAVEELGKRDTEIAARRKAHLEAYYGIRLRQVAGELASTTDERIRRMKQAEQNRLAVTRAEKLSEIHERRPVDIVTTRLAIGLIEIRHAE